ncbi:MAG TPA: hypothetical protein PLL75_07745 [Candidatus Omnitrophota bacterium]|nr:hypothetical protein [Candidatus Omnitrophota bacterium]HPS37600.1 hypothetical protein [Candidatus Omnitrophota bacterium]
MSLIQQALDKTNRAQETLIRVTPSAPKPWQRDPMGGQLEQELTRVQQAYSRRQKFYWIAGVGCACILLAGIIFYSMDSVRKSPVPPRPVLREAVAVIPAPAPASVPAPVAVSAPRPQVFQNTFVKVSFRLTGITNLGPRSVAIIDGRIVGEGDVLSGKAFVKSVGKDLVRLDVQGKEVLLTLH